MNYPIDVIDETEELTAEQLELVTQILGSSCQRLQLPVETESSVLFVSKTKIQALNHEYRNKNEVTDVLSFALNDDEEDAGFQDEHLLGDIVICVERMKEQAKEYNHSIERELGFLAIHGLLHLIGYDHQSEADEKEMFALQEELLTAYGLERET
ncbi:rRNA maturation RNase YbeY [Geomicrobium sp. JCM 19039]|uniref:rRNA maturation RNase YbeY n=1 Tax=Geomicrobium sp. JCM 19039 TaxID=1460636 RepID=UPI00045F48F7|nr:rRNA maturation RNase YbeY [Geomicrobium sp. JCM 19039]GAK11467.1 metal-dependent hydrolase [Geomicrobium sp. JCM 19039]